MAKEVESVPHVHLFRMGRCVSCKEPVKVRRFFLPVFNTEAWFCSLFCMKSYMSMLDSFQIAWRGLFRRTAERPSAVLLKDVERWRGFASIPGHKSR